MPLAGLDAVSVNDEAELAPALTPAAEAVRANELPPLALRVIVEAAVSVMETAPPAALAVNVVELREVAPLNVMPLVPAVRFAVAALKAPVALMPPAAALA